MMNGEVLYALLPLVDENTCSAASKKLSVMKNSGFIFFLVADLPAYVVLSSRIHHFRVA